MTDLVGVKDLANISSRVNVPYTLNAFYMAIDLILIFLSGTGLIQDLIPLSSLKLYIFGICFAAMTIKACSDFHLDEFCRRVHFKLVVLFIFNKQLIFYCELRHANRA